MKNSFPNEIFEFIKANGILTLAVGDREPWVCTLYYGTDDELNFYLVTDSDSEHGKMLQKNSSVAFCIFDSYTKITEPKKGLQGKGVCAPLVNIVEVTKGLLIWHKANPGSESKITLENLKKWKTTKIYKIEPSYLKYFDKLLYGEEEYGIWKK